MWARCRNPRLGARQKRRGASQIRDRDDNRGRLSVLHFGWAAMRAKLITVARAVAICVVIAVLAWSKSHGTTIVLPYFPHQRKRISDYRCLEAQ